ncbi:hypothetical protein, partial [Enterococcus mundtii]|uniref:hypothetical protein n=1 Tax=Enterococcus mundtii TaxID=53346 RepID=UPI0032DF35E7
FKKTSHMAMESKKAYGFLFQISTKTNKKELAIKPLLFVYSLRIGDFPILFIMVKKLIKLVLVIVRKKQL